MDKATPNHIAIIPDGNRRWAKEHHLPKFEGHRRGAETALKTARYLRKCGIHTFTLWVFSTENSSRDDEEVKNLMKLFEQYFDKLANEALRDKIRMIQLGRRDRIPQSLADKIRNIEEKTHDFKDYTFNIALDYGGHDEIFRAIAKIRNSNIEIRNPEDIAQFLDTAGQLYPNPDLVIRTSGEMRTSGLLPWQTAYSEYIFLDKYFPDLNEDDIDDAIEEYSKRQRRFGK